MKIKSISKKNNGTQWAVIDDNGNVLFSGNLEEAQVYYDDNKNDTIENAYIVAGEVVNEKRKLLPVSRQAVLSGFDRPVDVDMDFDDASREFTLSAIGDDYAYVTVEGIAFQKNNDSVTLDDLEGTHYIYYDTDGVLKSEAQIDRITQWDLMNTTLPVAYVIYDSVNKKSKFVTELLKSRTIVIGAWCSDFYSNEISLYDGMAIANDPSEGGTTTPSGSDDTSAQFSASSGYIRFIDRVLSVKERLVGDTWEVYYQEDGDLRSLMKSGFPVLTDIDLGIDTTGRMIRNTEALPIPVSSGDFCWYFLGITNDKDDQRRLTVFAGVNEYGNANSAENALQFEKLQVEQSFGLRQETTFVYAVLFQVNNSYSNQVKARIRVIENLAGVSGVVLA